MSLPAGQPAQEPFHGLLEIGRALRAGGELHDVLAAVASAVRRASGFGTAVINLRRPAWDDFEVVVVEGSAEARAALMGALTTSEEWGGLLQERFRHGGAYFIPAGATDSGTPMASYIPRSSARATRTPGTPRTR